jgi:hypothetical protein
MHRKRETRKNRSGRQPARRELAPAPINKAAPLASSAQAVIPDTPAGRALSAWLEAFNSADRARIETYIQQHAAPNDSAKLNELKAISTTPRGGMRTAAQRSPRMRGRRAIEALIG